MACSITTLPAVSPVSLIDCSIGTPEETEPEKVRDQRASATFWTTSPILKGRRRVKRCHISLPFSVFFHLKKPQMESATAGTTMYQEPVRRLETPTQSAVGAGSPDASPGCSSASSLKMLAKTGITNMTIAISTTMAKPKTSDGYIIADLTWRLSASDFST